MDVFDLQLYNNDLLKLGFRFLHDLLFLTLVVRFAWQPNSRDREFAFAAVMLNITVFFICFTMKKLELSLGMALGLFAIFGVLRYRTTSISTKDLTYLFVVIGIAVVNALANSRTSYLELLLVNSVILGAAIVGESLIARRRRRESEAEPAARRRQRRQAVVYDNLELLAPGRREELLADLRLRTHLPVSRVRVEDLDLTRGRANLSVWFEDEAVD